MRIVRIAASGFRGIRGALDIELPASFAIISGRNGSGKSTVCDAIEFGLTGRLSKHYLHVEKGEEVSDYTWWRGPGGPKAYYVSLTLATDNGPVIEITRTPDGRSTMSDENIKRVLCSSSSPAEEVLAEICLTSIIRDESITQFSVDLNETDRFKFVRDAVGTSSLAAMEEKCNEVVGVLEQSRAAVEGEYRSIRFQIESNIAQLSQAEAHKGKPEEASQAEKVLRSLLTESPPGIDDLLQAARGHLSQLRQRVAVLEETRKQLNALEIQRTEIRTPEYVERQKKQKERLRDLRRALMEVEKEAATVEEEIAQQQREAPRLASLAEIHTHGQRLGLEDNHCPLCGSLVDEDRFLQHLQDIQDRIAKRRAVLSSLSEHRASLQNRIRELQNDVAESERVLSTLTGTADAVSAALTDLSYQLHEIGLEVDESPTLGRVENEIENCRADIISIEASIAIIDSSHAMDRVNTLMRDLEQVRLAGVRIEDRSSKIARALERAHAIRHAVKRVSGEIVEERLASLTPLMAELYYRLRPHVEWTDINYRMRGDIRRFVSLTIGEDLNPRFMFSSGQRRALGLAFLLAVHLSRQWCHLRTLVLDDPVQHVDDYRALHLAEVLSAIRGSGRQVICTVEDPALARLLTRRLRSADGDEGSLINMRYDFGEGVRVEGRETIPPIRRLVLEPTG